MIDNYCGGMSEWQGAGLENRCRRKLSGFESQSLRQLFTALQDLVFVEKQI